MSSSREIMEASAEKVEGSHDVAGLVAYGGGDRVEVGGELFVVDREVFLQDRGREQGRWGPDDQGG